MRGCKDFFQGLTHQLLDWYKGFIPITLTKIKSVLCNLLWICQRRNRIPAKTLPAGRVCIQHKCTACLKIYKDPVVGFLLTDRSLLSSQPPRTSSGWCCAGSAGIAGLPSPSCTAASDAHSHDLLLSLVCFTKREEWSWHSNASTSSFKMPHGRTTEVWAR